MKKAIVSLLAIMLVLVLLPSCTTTVGVKTLVPSEVNLGGYKKIAIASTTFNSLDISYPSLMSSFDSILGYYGWGSIYDVYPWQNTGYVPKRGDMGPYENLIPKIPTLVSSNLKSQMENYYTSGTVEAMAQGFYELFDPTATDAIIKAGKRGNTTIRSMLQSQGVDALLTTNVDDMTYEEYITMEKKKDNFGNDLYEYYLIQKAYLRISYKVVDVDNNVILSTENYSKKYENKVKIAHTYKDGTTTKVQSDYNSYSVTKASDIFKELSQGFFSILLNKLVPHYQWESLTLMNNKPKDEGIKDAYDLVKYGSYNSACELFKRNWETKNHFPSGYNCALLQFAMGLYDEAIDTANDVFYSTGNSKALNLRDTLIRIKLKNDAAQEEIEKTSKEPSNANTELIGF